MHEWTDGKFAHCKPLRGHGQGQGRILSRTGGWKTGGQNAGCGMKRGHVLLKQLLEVAKMPLQGGHGRIHHASILSDVCDCSCCGV
jgi:hypothetical protein